MLPASALVYSTYLGGTDDDKATGIAIDPAGLACIIGYTNSADFPKSNALQPIYGGGVADAFVSKFNVAGNSLIYSTYVGGSQNETGYSIAVDATGKAYLTGATDSTDFPTKNALQPNFGGGGLNAFVSEIRGDGSDFVYSTYLGGSGGAYARSIAVDTAGNAYVTGYAAPLFRR